MFLNYYADMIPALFIFHPRARLYFCTGIKKRKDKHENSNTNHTRKKKPDARLAFRALGRRNGIALLFLGLRPAQAFHGGRVRRASGVRNGIPYNIVALYFNGLSLGCMWGVIFSFLEGRRTTDILASIMGVSMALSSGVAKSLGLYALNQLHVSEFWMPALIGAAAFPLLCFTGWMMTRFPKPTEADIASRSERVTLNGHQRWALFRRFMPLLILLFGANLLLTVQRDIKEDFIVCIIDVDTISSWAFAQIDSIATFVLLAVFALLATTYNHLKVLCMLLMLSTVGMGTLAFLGATEGNETIPTTIWLFLQSLCLDIAYLSFQTIFFERFIACFKIKGNVGFFIITIDFVGYLGTLGLLLFKEFCASHIDWTSFYNHMSLYIGVACCFAFIASLVYMIHVRNRKQGPLPEKAEEAEIEETEKENTIYLTTTAI